MLINPRQPSQQENLPLYSATACAELDRLVIAAGTLGFNLMQRASRSAWQVLEQRWPQASCINVFCGGGNNGGDGLLLALYAAQAGYKVRLWLAVEPNQYKNEAAEAWAELVAYGLQPERCEPSEAEFATDEVLVDALLGIGLQGEVRGKLVAWIQTINAIQAAVLSLDTPSGLLVDTGQLAGIAVEADLTLTFIALKIGLFTGSGADVSGEVVLSNLGITTSEWPVEPSAYLQQNNQTSPLPPRKTNNHKGSHGRLLIIGGLSGMGGAALLAAQAALRTGAGMVKVLTAGEQVAGFLAAQPEIMVQALTANLAQQLTEAFEWADVLLIGPGLGQSDLAKQLWQLSFKFTGPMLVDADALNLWAKGYVPPANPQRVITPHPGEAARLLGRTSVKMLENRLETVTQLAQKTASVALLKGAGSLVVNYPVTNQPFTNQPLAFICPFGNPGMGVAGMGDLLSGCIAALMAQGLTAHEAALAGMKTHALAGDLAAGDTPRGLLPTDLLPFLRKIVN